ncbi:unnamed protein product [Auanema sp. JU1783]|nr:unnamed protein product [Auanema sp. JU1783]
MYIFLLNFLIVQPLFITSLSLYEDNDLEPYFTDNLVGNVQDELARMQERVDMKPLLHKIGILAFYSRIHKSLVPTTRGNGYLHQWPEPKNDLDRELVESCLDSLQVAERLQDYNKFFKKCVDYVLNYLKLSQPWLLPENNSFPQTTLSEENMKQFINDNLLQLELSTSQVFCFLAMNEVIIFEDLPFCRYDVTWGKQGNLLWRGAEIKQKPGFIDELNGMPFECAVRSFCPDPCCSSVDKNSVQFTERECHRNVCKKPELCSMKRSLNNEFNGIRNNQWNISCPCPAGQEFRSDVEHCVHNNACGRQNMCSDSQECRNMIGGMGFKCLCRLGSVKTATNTCVEYGPSSESWHGLAFSEPHPSKSVYALQLNIFITLYCFASAL